MCTDLVAREQSMYEECRDLKRWSGQRCSWGGRQGRLLEGFVSHYEPMAVL